MVALKGLIIEKGATSYVKDSVQRQINKRALQIVGQYWGGEVLPRHFAADAKYKYGYRKRSAKYQRRKWKLFGDNRDLIYSGSSMEGTKNYRVRSTANQAIVSVPPGNINWCGLAGELVALTDREAVELSAILKHEYYVHLESATKSTTKKTEV